MSVLRKEEPLSTAAREGTVLDQTEVDPADRRPPRSVAPQNAEGWNTADTSAAEIDDTRDDAGADYRSQVAAPSRPQTVPSASVSHDEAPHIGPASQMPATSSSGALSSARQTPASRDDNPAFAPLFAEDELRDFRARWDQVQTSFVDEPRNAVEQADTLVAAVVKRIAEQFAEERAKLEQQRDRGDNVSTEDLRQGMKRYRTFFDRLLSF
jgi:hypothetical protein